MEDPMPESTEANLSDFDAKGRAHGYRNLGRVDGFT